jgi:predicted O-methyltransferase YrrM
VEENQLQSRELSLVEKVTRNARIIVRTRWTPYRLSRAACAESADQKWVELAALAHLVRQTKPQWTMEIGIYEGGTIGLWAQMMPAQGTLIGIDLKLSKGVEERIRLKMKPGQNLHLLELDSHSLETRMQLTNILGENRVDFLFIDGDHSYKGVRQDFEDYSPLVRPGGIVAFHDIIPYVPDHSGPEAESQSIEVSQFWGEIKSRFPHREFVEDRAQGCCGIGVLQF